jgi:hypothetical protein
MQAEDIERNDIFDGISEKFERNFLMMERRFAESEKQRELSVLSAAKDIEISILREKNRRLEEERRDNDHFAIMASLRK